MTRSALVPTEKNAAVCGSRVKEGEMDQRDGGSARVRASHASSSVSDGVLTGGVLGGDSCLRQRLQNPASDVFLAELKCRAVQLRPGL